MGKHNKDRHQYNMYALNLYNKHTRRVLSIYEFQIYEYMIFVNVHIMYWSLHPVYKNVNKKNLKTE